MNSLRESKYLRFALLSVLSLAVMAIPLAKRAKAALEHEHDHEGDALKIEDLAGSWQAALVYSNTGCGPASGLVNFTLDSNGTTNTATLVFHTHVAGPCMDSTSTQTFTVQTLNPDGSGTAGLTCGTGCGWQFNIQVDRQRSIFNLVDVDPQNPDNFVAGTAIRQLKTDSH
jgi:hypothetical protein